MLKLATQYLHHILWMDVIQKTLEDWDYLYIGTAKKWSLTSAEQWKVKRIDKTNWEILWSENYQIFDDATSLDYE